MFSLQVGGCLLLLEYFWKFLMRHACEFGFELLASFIIMVLYMVSGKLVNTFFFIFFQR